MKKIPYTQKDFDWVKMTPAQMKKFGEEALAHKKENYKKIKSILPENRTYENTVYALANSSGKYGNLFEEMAMLKDVSPKKEIRDTAVEVLTDVSSKSVDIEYDREIYTSLLEYYEGNFADEKKSLKKEDIKLLEEAIRDYKRMGFDLPETKQKELKKLLKETSKLSFAFRKNINDYSDYILCTKEELDGLSERFIATLPKHLPAQAGTDGRYMVTLQYPHIGPFMSEAKNREKRKELAEKNLKKGGVKNLKIINEIVELRAKISKILGYKHHADFVTENRMAKTAETAIKFQDELLKKLLPKTKEDMKELREHAKTLGIKKLEYYDVAFVQTDLKKKLYDLDPETVRSYFQLDHVLKGMFSLYENLFGIKINEKEMKLWHKDIKFFEVTDTTNKNALIGYFAMDMFPREGKYGHACLFDIIVSHPKEWGSDEYISPFSTIMCNFTAPNKKTPSLLSIGEIETLFHEFGHNLHLVLSVARHESQGGCNVAWDFVETPSQIMENWVMHKDVLSKLSKHYITGKSMPKDMIERIVNGKKFQNVYHFTRQIIMGKLDLDLHTGKTKDGKNLYIKMIKNYFGLDLPKDSIFPAGFGHLVGYDAGYYSYLWALVYACDAFSEFENKGNKNILKNKEIGMKWRREVLEKGSSEDEMKLIKNFLGRDPNQKAFLKEVGI